MKDTKNIKYIIYARKSSESEDRQVQSIEDQITRLKELAKNLGLNVVDILSEAKSAKAPNKRAVFNEMMRRLEAGEANGILCWHIDRLSRNPVDSGNIHWLLQQSILQEIQTAVKKYSPEDCVLMFNLESGMANDYIIKLKRDVKRGNRGRLEKGWRPNCAPLGYLNARDEQDNGIIIEDPERFPLIRKMWDMMLTGKYTPPQILEIANNEWGFRTKKTKRQGGKPLARSALYRIFTSEFYAGTIKYAGEEYEGSHNPMVTLDEFDRVQYLLGRKGKPRAKKHKFPFTGSIRCGECGCLVTAEHKYKKLKEGGVNEHTYYHCTRKRADYNCSQRHSVTEANLDEQICNEISKFTITPRLREWALGILRSSNEKEIAERQQVHESQNRAVETTQRELDNLTKMRYRDLIDDEAFLKEKESLQGKIRELRRHLKVTEERADNWLELTEQVFDFATHARESFINGDIETKKQILVALGSNPMLKDGKLSIDANEWFIPIIENKKAIEAEIEGLEPSQMQINKGREGHEDLTRPCLLGGRDSNPNMQLQRLPSYRWTTPE